MSTSVMTRKSPVTSAAPPASAARAPMSTRTFNAIALVVLIVFAVIWLIPSLFALKTSLTDNGVAALGAREILKNWNPTVHSFASLLGGSDIWNWYLASGITSVLTTILTVVFASMAAFSLSRLTFRGSNVVLTMILLGIMIPAQVLIVPIFQELNAIGLLNTYWSVIFPQVPAVIAVFIFKQFFDGIPKDFEEAARIDGASVWKVYTRVVMPLSRPVIAAVTVLTFVGVWNNLLLPLYVLSNPGLMTIPVGLATTQGSYGLRYADIQAGALLAALPLIIIYLIFQRQIVEGVAGSGLKG
ncbi:carbohydrate ABC transporter permease [Acidipropionibacterium acidipropionici]|jgi:multiple sugar transport system permease protein|uniref:Sugar ABC transporter permease n=3 Tax=Acidipropionibacterium acidipropionici TaxID=1748 RepID=A0A142KF72_9ACTN|nr:ABC-type sugar transport system, permease component [Acidipropionibacterium acidipropionici ATCC 4875]ALN15753.1 sugar ABC transporter permease [Acidipropionibacterium acidipropionici]AMS04760.1 sugar ABC transporter permease [Acidipropionibacterium acidipropionici]AOZ46250.1 sugar ABC transporter permease [Acidipropionibacterium acidipropionici]APZ08503.1 sugar ABC transporter permease [Acidipropionibacterium acidipropionici]